MGASRVYDENAGVLPAIACGIYEENRMMWASAKMHGRLLG